MKHVLMLSDLSNPHTIKWASGVTSKGYKVSLFGLTPPNTNYYNEAGNIDIYHLDMPKELFNGDSGNIKKLRYLSSVSTVKKLIKQIKPDILHAHFATSYGLIGALAGFKPYVLSVWGKDVFVFPQKSFLHKKLFQFNISKANRILSTSNVMADEIRKYTNRDIEVTPFGIDLEKFRPETLSNKNPDELVIGLLKGLEKKYGIDYLIDAFAKLCNKYPDLNLKLLIVGDGTQKEHLQALTCKLGVQNKVTFTGRIEFMKVPEYHNMMDIEVYPSLDDSESFGVSIVEAEACGKPVVVSNVGGLPEVVEADKTGFVIPKMDSDKIVEAISRFIENRELIKTMGNAGRKRVEAKYNFVDNLQTMVNVYKSLF